MTEIDSYIASIPEEDRKVFLEIRSILSETLIPLGFEEMMSYGMLGYVVPFSLYPAGYHVDSKLPLPFVAIAKQKHGIHLYHLGIYSDIELLNWWQKSHAELQIGKLDMGKSCIRFKSLSKVPYQLIRELMQKMNTQDWIRIYEQSQK